VDVLCVHPSPVNTNFYNADTAHKSPVLVFASKFVYGPPTIANIMFSNVGKFGVVYDQGYWSVGAKALFKLIDWNLFAAITTVFAPFTAEYKKLTAERAEVRKKAK